MSTTPPALRHRDDIIDYADVAFQHLAAQISANYLKYIKARVIPELGKYSNTPLRELRTLMAIAHFADPIRGARISRLLSYDPATVTRSARWLIENNLIEIRDDIEDARSVYYGLTGNGLELSNLYRDLTRQSIIELNSVDSESLNRRDIRKVISVLEKIQNRSQIAAQLGAEYKRAKKRRSKPVQNPNA